MECLSSKGFNVLLSVLSSRFESSIAWTLAPFNKLVDFGVNYMNSGGTCIVALHARLWSKQNYEEPKGP